MTPAQGHRATLLPHQPQSLRTCILSWVVNVEVPIPHHCQLHRQVVDLHSFVGILQPGQERREESWSEISRETLEWLGAIESTQG